MAADHESQLRESPSPLSLLQPLIKLRWTRCLRHRAGGFKIKHIFCGVRRNAGCPGAREWKDRDESNWDGLDEQHPYFISSCLGIQSLSFLLFRNLILSLLIFRNQILMAGKTSSMSTLLLPTKFHLSINSLRFRGVRQRDNFPLSQNHGKKPLKVF